MIWETDAFFILACTFFWLLLLYYSMLTIAGILFRGDKPKVIQPVSFPSVSILIPAYNEGVVLAQTLDAMSKLTYPGELTIYVLNDSSQDNTAEIADYYAGLFPRIKHIPVPPGGPKGKARVLNYGLSLSQSDYFAVYDADNQPEPNALQLLVEKAVSTKNAVGAVGYVKTLNEQKNWLTRMIALEFQAFQLIMQCGRWKLFKLGSLTGTNMLVSRKAIKDVGGYDPYALAEDADLTLALTARGGLLPVVPDSVTWEQEPETLGVWLKQRTRWSQGNFYLLVKTLREPCWLRGRAMFHIIQQFAVYIGFAILLIASDAWLVMGVLGKVSGKYDAPLLLLWFQSYIVYLMQLVSAQVVDKRISSTGLLIATIMYITYAQFFLLLLVRGAYFLIKQLIRPSSPTWDKTERFSSTEARNRRLGV